MYTYDILGSTVAIKATCRICQDTHFYSVPYKNFEDWQAGELIQDCFPFMEADARELLISGVCGKCYDDLFSEETLPTFNPPDDYEYDSLDSDPFSDDHLL